MAGTFRETAVYRVTGRMCEREVVREIEEWDETRDEERKRLREWSQYVEEDFLSVTAGPIPPHSFSQKIKYWSISQVY